MKEAVKVGTFGRFEIRIHNLVGAFDGKSQPEDLRADGMISTE